MSEEKTDLAQLKALADWLSNDNEPPSSGDALCVLDAIDEIKKLRNPRPDSKPYKFENPEHGWQNEDDPDAQLEWDSYRDGFNAAREHKGEG